LSLLHEAAVTKKDVFLGGASNVKCDFQKPETCSYTRGSCWDIAPLSVGVYGELSLLVQTLIFCITCDLESSDSFEQE